MLSPCLTWTAPDARQYDDRYADTTKRDRGTFFHQLIATFVQGGLVASSGDREMTNMYLAAKQYVEQVLGPRCESIQAEACVAINWETGEAKTIKLAKERDYPYEDGWTYGTADLVCILKDGSLLVADWKTGGTEGAEHQLLSLACGLRKCTSVGQEPYTSFRPVRISCLKVFEGGVVADEREVSGDELAIHWDSMKMAYQDAQNEPGEPFPGIHCTTLYCPHLAFCGAVGGLVQDAADGPQAQPKVRAHGGWYSLTDSPTSDAHAGWVMERVAAAKRQLDYYTNAMKDYVNRGGRVVSGGFEWSKGMDGFRWRRQR